MQKFMQNFSLKSRTTKYLIPLIVITSVLLVAMIGFGGLRVSEPPYFYTIQDRDRVKYVQSNSPDPAVVLEEQNISLSEDDRYELSKDQDGTHIQISRAQCVKLSIRGQVQSVYTQGETVAALLDRLNVDTSEPWEVSVALSEQTYDGMEIAVDYVQTVEETVSCPLSFSTVYCYDPSLPEGEEEVLSDGICGTQESRVLSRYVNDACVDMTVLDSTVTQKATHRVIAVGTGESVGQARSYPLYGDNVIVTEEGKYLYYSRVDTYEATGYTSWIEDVTGTTACGTAARVGSVAVDPSMIPYFTKMFIVSNDGVYVYGEASAEDCGGAIQGKIIDLFFDTEAECWQFGRRDIQVYFLTDEPT